MRKTKEITPFTEMESLTYMADGIEKSARECARDGFPEKAESMLAWAAEVRAKAALAAAHKNLFD
jgi:hypothetical protein